MTNCNGTGVGVEEEEDGNGENFVDVGGFDVGHYDPSILVSPIYYVMLPMFQVIRYLLSTVRSPIARRILS